MSDEPSNTGRKADGRFAPGNRANPTGRPAGSRNKATLALEKLMVDDAEDVVKAMLAAAKGGYVQAAKVILDRVVPVRKGRLVEIDLPTVETAEDVVTAMSAVVGAMAEGTVTPEEADVIASVLDVKRRAIETVELAEEVARIRAHVGLDPSA